MQTSKTLLKNRPQLLFVFNPTGEVPAIYIVREGAQLGSLEAKILQVLLSGPASNAEVARRLQTWHQATWRALENLEKKGLVKSTGFAGKNLEGTPIMRRLYTLNPNACYLAVPLPAITIGELQAAAKDEQNRAILIQRFGRALEQLHSRSLIKQHRGADALRQLRRQIDQALREKHLCPAPSKSCLH